MFEATAGRQDTGQPLALKGLFRTPLALQRAETQSGPRGNIEFIRYSPNPQTSGYLVHLDGVGGHELGSIDLAVCPPHLNHFPCSRRTQLETILTLREQEEKSERMAM